MIDRKKKQTDAQKQLRSAMIKFTLMLLLGIAWYTFVGAHWGYQAIPWALGASIVG